MTEEDIKTGRKLLEEDFIKANPEWVKELEIMLQVGPDDRGATPLVTPPTLHHPTADEREGRDPGAQLLWLPVPEPGLPAAQAAGGGLDLTSVRPGCIISVITLVNCHSIQW